MREPAANELVAFVARHAAVATDTGVWRDGAIRLQIGVYLSVEVPPSASITSVRSVILRGNDVLTVRNAHEWHVLPGGRREPGETPEETLRREVLEEAGLHIERPAQLGFLHLHHVTPKPDGYGYPYPDFMSLVYVSQAGRPDMSGRVVDDYEEEALFRPVAEARLLDLSIPSRVFLEAALPLTRSTG